jgi:hypothetical protein
MLAPKETFYEDVLHHTYNDIHPRIEAVRAALSMIATHGQNTSATTMIRLPCPVHTDEGSVRVQSNLMIDVALFMPDLVAFDEDVSFNPQSMHVLSNVLILWSQLVASRKAK